MKRFRWEPNGMVTDANGDYIEDWHVEVLKAELVASNKYVAELEAEVARLKELAVEWQPIATLPTDYEEEEDQNLLFYDADDTYGREPYINSHWDHLAEEYHATHWAYLPGDPK